MTPLAVGLAIALVVIAVLVAVDVASTPKATRLVFFTQSATCLGAVICPSAP